MDDAELQALSREAAQTTPLVDLLRRIPIDHRTSWSSGPHEATYCPIGIQAHEAADRIRSLEEEVAALKVERDKLAAQIRHLYEDITHCPNPSDTSERFIQRGKHLTFSNMVNASYALLQDAARSAK